MEALHLAIAMGPAAIYLLAIGGVNASRRPLVITGFRDSCALAIGISGLMMIGPIYLFLPQDAAAVFGPYTWALLLSFYALSALLVILFERPRLVIYNATLESVREALERCCVTLDPAARWAGDTLVLPHEHVELRLESSPQWRNVSLVANHDQQGFRGWQALERALARQLATVEVPRQTHGLNLIALALGMLGLILWHLARDPNRVAQTLRELLQL